MGSFIGKLALCRLFLYLYKVLRKAVLYKKEIVNNSLSYLNTKLSFNIIYLENLFNKNE